jgi:AraC family transcriptional regulator
VLSQHSSSAAHVQKLLEHIQHHLDSPMPLSSLSGIDGLSTFHLQRIFKEATGHSPAQRVRLLRLKRASVRLAFEPWRSVTDIALEAGYLNAESFTRAFHRLLRQAPREFRGKPDWRRWRLIFTSSSPAPMPLPAVEIVDFASTAVAAVEHFGSSVDVYDSTRRLVEWRRINRVPVRGHRTLCVLHDLRTQASSGFRIDVCVSFRRAIAPNPQGVVAKVIPGGRCARVRYVGPREYIPVLHPLYAEWLPRSGERLRQCSPILHFVNVGADVAGHEMITDVYLPVQ